MKHTLENHDDITIYGNDSYDGTTLTVVLKDGHTIAITFDNGEPEIEIRAGGRHTIEVRTRYDYDVRIGFKPTVVNEGANQ